MRITRRKRVIPQLNTSSLPDLIFTVLFFFMIVTHMRRVALKVEYQVPAGTELTRLTKKTSTSYIYIGRPMQGGQGGMQVQLNDKLCTPDEVGAFVSSERQRMNPIDAQNMIVSIKADRRTPMALITQVKQALRQAQALRINYSATDEIK